MQSFFLRSIDFSSARSNKCVSANKNNKTVQTFNNTAASQKEKCKKQYPLMLSYRIILCWEYFLSNFKTLKKRDAKKKI